MKKILFLLVFILFPLDVFAVGELVFDVEALKINNNDMYIGGWAIVAEKNFSAGSEINLANNINGIIEVVAIGENGVETVGDRTNFNAHSKTFKNNTNNDLLYPSRCNRRNLEYGNNNTCGETIYNGNDALGRGPLTCNGTGSNGSSCLSRNTNFAFKFDLSSLKTKYGNQTINFIIRIKYYEVKLNYGTKYFTMSKKNNNLNTVTSNIVISESSIDSVGNDVSVLPDTKDILIETDDYSVVVEAVGTKFVFNTDWGRVLNSSANYLYDSTTYWNFGSYSVLGTNYIQKTEVYDRLNKIYKGCHYGTQYCNSSYTYNIKHYNLAYGGISNGDTFVGDRYTDGWANPAWGSITGGLKLKINDVFVPQTKNCLDNVVVNKNNIEICESPNMSASCEHTVSKIKEDVALNYENLTPSICKNRGYSSKLIYTKDFKFYQKITIDVFDKMEDFDSVSDINIFRGGSFSIGATYGNITNYNSINGTDKYYVEYYIEIDEVCKPRYLSISPNEARVYNLTISDDDIKNNYYNNNVTTTLTEWYDSNDETRGKTNTSGNSVFVDPSDGVNFKLRNAYINLYTAKVRYSSCSNGESCRALSDVYFVPLNYYNNRFPVDITFNNINRLNIMNGLFDEYEYKCSIRIKDGNLENMKYRVIDLVDPFPNVRGNNYPKNWIELLTRNNNNLKFLYNRYIANNKEYYKANLTTNNISLVRENNDNNLSGKYLEVGSSDEKTLIGNNNIFSSGGNIKKYRVGYGKVNNGG